MRASDIPRLRRNLPILSLTACSRGMSSYWVPQPLGPDTLTCVALTSANTGSMRIGTAVVPT